MNNVYDIDINLYSTDEGFEVVVFIGFNDDYDGRFNLNLSLDEFKNITEIIEENSVSLPDRVFYMDASFITNEFAFRKEYTLMGDVDNELNELSNIIGECYGIPMHSNSDYQWLENQLKTIKG